ncbi:MAG: acetyl-CoA C-acyltransferase [Planctomycetota bacterium]|jgi:acetyl-CoA acyltransferase|nr:acetyl-CoA C-acyltransferase [Planctomycetota bacterium]
MTQQEAVLVSCVRTPVGRAKRGSLAQTMPVTLGAKVVREAIQRVPGLEAERVDDVLMGCAMPEGPQGLNMGRLVAQRAGLPDTVPGATINRFCSSGLQTIAMASQAIEVGQSDIVIAGGAESMTMVPMEGFQFIPDPTLIRSEPNAYISMGLTAERVAEKFKVSRDDQDAFATRSHQRAVDAIDAARFEDEIVALKVEQMTRRDGAIHVEQVEFSVDEGPRPETNIETLSALRPVFKKGGTVTAGNCSQMSDGAAAAVVMSEDVARELGATPLARLVSFSVAGVSPDIMGIGPVEAVPKALARAGLKLSDIGLFELNEAFASQSLAVIRQLGLDENLVNVNGGAIALGHPLGCTGTKLTATLLQEMQRRGVRYGIVTMCIGSGMGAAGIFENLRL